MTLGSIHRQLSHWRRWALAMLVGSGFAIIPSCDAEVQNVLIQGLANAAIQALEVKYTRDVDTTPNPVDGVVRATSDN